MTTAQQFCKECQQERKQFAAEGTSHSPSCAALWRLAFGADEDAWRCVQTIFAPWLQRLGDAALSQVPKVSGLSKQDLPDLMQDVWHNLWRYVARNRADAQALVANDEIGRVIALLKTIAKNRVLELCRKPRGYEEPFPTDEAQDSDEDTTRQPPVGQVKPPDEEGVLDLVAFLQKHIRTEQELRVAEVIFLQGMKPQDVVALYSLLFSDVKAVNQVQQTLVRRLRSDPARRNFGGSASLEFRVEEQEVLMQDHQNPGTGCPFAEDILLDYLNGHVDAARKAAIEASPACRQAAAALQADLIEWRPSLREMFCPAQEELVAYQERRLPNTAVLLVHNHLQRCPFCRAEIQLLAAMDEVPLDEPSFARRLYTLIFQPATLSPVPVLGEGSYRTVARTPQIELLVRTTKAHGKQRSWTLFGRLRYENDQPFFALDEIFMLDLEDDEAERLTTTIDEQGAFVIKGLSAGKYELHIIAGDEEIILHDFHVGEAQP